MTSVLKVTTLQNLNSSTIITQTNATTLTLGTSGQTISIPAGATINTSTINVTTVVLAAGAVGTPSLTTSGDTNTGIFFPSADTIAFTEGGTEAMRIDSSANLQFNSGFGSVATAFGCRAWVNFNGTGTPAIRASGNVTSITDNGTGQYAVNFTTAMPDANYTTCALAGDDGVANTDVSLSTASPVGTTVVKLNIFDSSFSGGGQRDSSFVTAAIFR